MCLQSRFKNKSLDRFQNICKQIVQQFNGFFKPDEETDKTMLMCVTCRIFYLYLCANFVVFASIHFIQRAAGLKLNMMDCFSLFPDLINYCPSICSFCGVVLIDSRLPQLEMQPQQLKLCQLRLLKGCPLSVPPSFKFQVCMRSIQLYRLL